MIKVLMVSDTHRDLLRLRKLMAKVGPVDYVFHMGDSECDRSVLEEVCGKNLAVVQGNCDFMVRHPKEETVDLGGHKFFLTHGHSYQVKWDLSMLKDAAWSRSADVVCFGHTHEPCIDYEGGVIAVNPGSLSLPRQEGRKPTYILLEIDDDSELHFALNYF